MVSGKDRVVAALAGEVIDRPPVSAWGHDYESEWFPKLLAGTTTRLAREFDWDWVKLQNRETCFAEALGGIYRPDPSGKKFPITVRKVERKEEWQDVIDRAEDTELADSLTEQIGLIESITADLGPERPVLQTVFSPLSVVGYLVGRDQGRAVAWLQDEPELMQRVLQAISGMLGRFASQSIESGAAGIYYAIVGYASTDLIPEDEYRQKVLRSDQAVLEQASAAWFNLAHLCFGNVHFGITNDLPVHAVSWATTDEGNPSLHAARSLTSKARVGGLGRHEPFSSGTPAQSYAASRKVLDENDPRGLMLSPGCSVSPWPWHNQANFMAFRAALEPAK